MHIHNLIIFICIILLLAYLFHSIALRYKIPSALMLMATGMILKYFFPEYSFPKNFLGILGTLGLIMIVLEAAMDLKFERQSLFFIRKTLLISLILTLFTTFGIALLLYGTMKGSVNQCLIYAIPFSIISSAIAIPSSHILSRKKKEFIIYESTFSDIIGILFFNFVIMYALNKSGLAPYALSVISIVILSLIFSFLLIALLEKVPLKNKNLLVLTLLILLYSLGESLHLSSLILVLVFGLLINNLGPILEKPFFRERFNLHYQSLAINEFKAISSEASFFIRSVFFVAFGYSIHFPELLNPDTLVLGGAILVFLYMARYVNLKLFIRTEIFPEILIAPRGLITILLFYSIPPVFNLPGFNSGILFLVILISNIVMAVGLLTHRDLRPEEMENGIDSSVE